MNSSDQYMFEEQMHQMFIESDDCVEFVNKWINQIFEFEVPHEIFVSNTD
jgi:hypothetical protein